MKQELADDGNHSRHPIPRLLRRGLIETMSSAVTWIVISVIPRLLRRGLIETLQLLRLLASPPSGRGRTLQGKEPVIGWGGGRRPAAKPPSFISAYAPTPVWARVGHPSSARSRLAGALFNASIHIRPPRAGRPRRRASARPQLTPSADRPGWVGRSVPRDTSRAAETAVAV